MSERWPAAMLFSTAAAYLDCSVQQIEKLLRAGEFGAVQFNERGDRRLLKEELDAYLYRLRNLPVTSPKENGLQCAS